MSPMDYLPFFTLMELKEAPAANQIFAGRLVFQGSDHHFPLRIHTLLWHQVPHLSLYFPKMNKGYWFHHDYLNEGMKVTEIDNRPCIQWVMPHASLLLYAGRRKKKREMRKTLIQ
jgi:hypothetical protein